MPPSTSPLSALSQAKQAGSEMGENIGAIASKNQSINQYKSSLRQPVSAPVATSPTLNVDKVNKGASGKYGSRPGEMRPDKVLGSFKKGGKVKVTGLIKVHGTPKRPEQILNAKQTAKVASKGGIGAVLSGKK